MEQRQWMKLPRASSSFQSGARLVPKWTPEPLPITQSDGDLDVTLTRLVYGVQGFMAPGME